MVCTPSLPVFFHHNRFSDFVVFYFIVAFRTDNRHPIFRHLEPAATFARRVIVHIRFVLGIQQLLPAHIAVQINLLAHFAIVPIEFGAAVGTYYVIGVVHLIIIQTVNHCAKFMFEYLFFSYHCFFRAAF